MIPENSPLEELAATNCIAIEDTSLILKEHLSEFESIANEDDESELWLISSLYAVEVNGYEPKGLITNVSSTNSNNHERSLNCPELQHLARIAVLCNESKLVQEKILGRSKVIPRKGRS